MVIALETEADWPLVSYTTKFKLYVLPTEEEVSMPHATGWRSTNLSPTHPDAKQLS